MGFNIDLLPLLFILIGLGSAFYMFGDLFGTSDKVKEDRPAPKSQKEKRERREERQRVLKAEYEEKKALKLKKRKEKDKAYQDKKEKERLEKEEKENLKKSIKEEKKRQKKEVDFFSWLKPKTKTTKLSNGDIIIEDRRNAKEFVPPLFGSSEKSEEEKSIDDKLKDLVKEFRDL